MDENDTFAEVRWCNEDLADALECNDVHPSAENVQKLRSLLGHWLEDTMVEAGWAFIEYVINQNWG